MSSPSTQVPGKPAIPPIRLRLVPRTALPSTHVSQVLESEDPKRANRGKNMAAFIVEEGLDEDGLPEKHPGRSERRQRKRKRKQARSVVQEEGDDDNEDSDFSNSGTSDESSSQSESNGSDDIPNDELADVLPSKTAPITKRSKMMTARSRQINSASVSSKAKSTAHVKKSRKVIVVEEVEDEDTSSPRDPPAIETMNNTEQIKKPGGVKRRNPVYLFYEVVPQNASGQPGDPGDKHYHCCHGNHKVLTVTKPMKSNLNGSCIFTSMKHTTSPTLFRTYWSPEALPFHVSALLCTQGPC
ncbi:hypothetical protein JOM56_012826 [Amanita muscaria]